MTHTKGQLQASSGPICFGPDNDLFGWLHVPRKRSQRPAVVICNPVGFEYIRANRGLRILAGQLAASGYFVLRFDYRSTGDSGGDEFDAGRVDAMLDSIRHAVGAVTDLAETERVSLIGLRLGATLAGKIAEERSLEQLVLWAPCDTGAQYVREQQIIAAVQKKRLSGSAGGARSLDGADAGGFLLTRETQEELGTLDLGSRPQQSSPPILLLNRDDMRIAPRLAQQLRDKGSDVDVVLSQDFRQMMMPPQLATVPTNAIDEICDWLESHNRRDAAQEQDGCFGAAPPTSCALELKGGVNDRPVRFGPNNSLFGIVSTAPETSKKMGPAVILLCGGATHRVSANRMYVTLARRLAANGTPAMRLDFAGIGDSLPHVGYPPNKPYTDRLADDVEAAMAALENITGRDRFLLFGLCSGAFAAMQAARRSARVTDLVLVNQLVYYLSSEDLDALVSGEIVSAHELDFPRSRSFVYRGTVKLLRPVSRWWGWPGERLSPYLLGGRLPRDLGKFAAHGIRLAFLQSSRDDAIDALSITSGAQVRQLADTGQARVKIFEGTDHTFSPTVSQQALSDWLIDYLANVANS